MTHYLMAIHRPEGYDPDLFEDEAMRRDITRLNQDMIVAGVRLFVGGLEPPDSARSLHYAPGGEITVSAGCYLQGHEHIGSVWVIDADSLHDALVWGRRAAVAYRASVEVRPFR